MSDSVLVRFRKEKYHLDSAQKNKVNNKSPMYKSVAKTNRETL